MSNEIDTNSVVYQLALELIDRITSSDNDTLKTTYEQGNLVYLDDDPNALKAFVSILGDIATDNFDNAPNHLKGELRSLSEQEIRKLLADHDILLYGRSGMRLNSRVLHQLQ